MKIIFFVEGPSDSLILNELFKIKGYKNIIGQKGWGIPLPIDLKNKPNFMKKIGPRAAATLLMSDQNYVVAIPDFYPNSQFQGPPYQHANLPQLKTVLSDLVKDSLINKFNCPHNNIQNILNRFYPTAFMHECEVLLLAVFTKLAQYIECTNLNKRWNTNIEQQNQNNPPKKIIQEIFRTKSRTKRAYREITDGPAIMRLVRSINEILYDSSGKVQCPEFKKLIDWILKLTQIPFP